MERPAAITHMTQWGVASGAISGALFGLILWYNATIRSDISTLEPSIGNISVALILGALLGAAAGTGFGYVTGIAMSVILSDDTKSPMRLWLPVYFASGGIVALFASLLLMIFLPSPIMLIPLTVATLLSTAAAHHYLLRLSR